MAMAFVVSPFQGRSIADDRTHCHRFDHLVPSIQIIRPPLYSRRWTSLQLSRNCERKQCDRYNYGHRYNYKGLITLLLRPLCSVGCVLFLGPQLPQTDIGLPFTHSLALSQSFARFISKSVTQSITQSANHLVSQSFSQPIAK